MRKLLAIDFSTSSTGIAVFCVETKKLLHYQLVTPRKVKKALLGACKLQNTVDSLKNLCEDIKVVVDSFNPDFIVIEEVNRGISRLGQKVLNMGHGFLYEALYSRLSTVKMFDSDGREGWRGPKRLNLILSEEDKASNKRNKALNKAIPKRSKNPKHPIFTKKDLAQRYVNRKYGLSLDVQARASDADLADAIGLGDVAVNLIKSNT